jgi:CheY-like chemotaxis protein
MMLGSISVESEPGRGSTFVVQLPAEVVLESNEPAREEPTSPISIEPDQNNRDTILVIDDDPSVRDLMSRFLGKQGFHVVTTHNGVDGIRLAREIKPFLITLDVMMPEIDGWSVLKQLKADPRMADIPVIIITIVDNMPLGVNLGAAGYLIKPVDRERLAVLVEQYRGSVGGSRIASNTQN